MIEMMEPTSSCLQQQQQPGIREEQAGEHEHEAEEQQPGSREEQEQEADEQRPLLGDEPAPAAAAAVFSIDAALARIRFGRWQGALLLFTGLAWMSDACEVMLLSFLGPAVRSGMRRGRPKCPVGHAMVIQVPAA